MGYKTINVELDLETVLDGVDFDDVLECYDTQQVLDAVHESETGAFQEYALKHVLPELEGEDCVDVLRPLLESLHDADPDVLQGLLKPYLPAPVKEEPHVTYYEVNVALHGRHYFATADRSLTDKAAAQKAYEDMTVRFPAEQGFSVSCTAWSSTGRDANFYEVK